MDTTESDRSSCEDAPISRQEVPEDALRAAAAAVPFTNRDAMRRIIEAAAPHLIAVERSRLFVAIRHALPLDAPWTGEALDLIFDVIKNETL